jgi:hypothetical protein
MLNPGTKNEAIKIYFQTLVREKPEGALYQGDDDIGQYEAAGFLQLMSVACHKKDIFAALVDQDLLPYLMEGFGRKATRACIGGFVGHFDFLKTYVRDPKTLEAATNALFQASPKAFEIRSEKILAVYAAGGRFRAKQANERLTRTTYEMIDAARWLFEQGALGRPEQVLCETLAFLQRSRTVDVVFERFLFLHLAGWPVADGPRLVPSLELLYGAHCNNSCMPAVKGFNTYLRYGEKFADSDYRHHLMLLGSLPQKPSGGNNHRL